MLFFNSDKRYGLIAILLHWVMAIIIIGLLCIGLYMTSIKLTPLGFKLYRLHKEYGVLILFLVIFRFFWRISNKSPELNLPWWEKYAALSMHWTFYFLMLAMPITGLVISGASGFKPSFFGLFLVPTLIAPNAHLLALAEKFHQWLGYLFIVCILMHMSAALKHHFVDKDNILRRMIS